MLPTACLAVLVVEVQCSAGVVHRRVLPFLQHTSMLLSGRTAQVCPSMANIPLFPLDPTFRATASAVHSGSSASTTEVMQAS